MEEPTAEHLGSEMEAHAAGSPLVAARMRRRLTLEDAAALTSLEVDDIKSL